MLGFEGKSGRGAHLENLIFFGGGYGVTVARKSSICGHDGRHIPVSVNSPSSSSVLACLCWKCSSSTSTS